MAENYQDRIYKASELLRQASDMLTEDTNSTLVPNIVAVPASTSIATSISSPVADTMCQIYDGDEFRRLNRRERLGYIHGKHTKWKRSMLQIRGGHSNLFFCMHTWMEERTIMIQKRKYI